MTDNIKIELTCKKCNHIATYDFDATDPVKTTEFKCPACKQTFAVPYYELHDAIVDADNAL